ncbi:DUF4136 domain-containing protein [Algoriphagus formosus]|uniref:DUF4136 domain-containing protein n=1 Tax=Algoriphagus formosus TaxID=2007308 RepID=A0A4R5UVS8_9BACT|nr:DUF4136 domain-containing protein [Algoriphagus aquimaris]TDK43368.1 DUF4136 domain-containing protein [Algoriphagus aquimaris]
MRHLHLIVLAAFSLASCKVSDSVTSDVRKNSEPILVHDLVSKSENLVGKSTFKVIAQTNASKDIVQLNRVFEKKLIQNGFSKVEENPELLIQSVVASVNFEQELVGTGGGVSPERVNSYDYKKSGQYGKVIFLIQDAKTNEVLWMGTGTGVLTANEILNSKEIKSTLDQLMANSK